MADLKMPEINNVTIAGNLTRDPVFKTASNGIAVATFTIASNRRFRDSTNQWQEDVCFVGVIARNRLADSCNYRLKKGSAVLIEGELVSKNAKDDEGNLQKVVEIKARRIQFLNKPTYPSNDQETDTPAQNEESDTTNADAVSTTGDTEQSTEPVRPVSFEDDSYNKFISSEESEFLKRDPSDK